MEVLYETFDSLSDRIRIEAFLEERVSPRSLLNLKILLPLSLKKYAVIISLSLIIMTPPAKEDLNALFMGTAPYRECVGTRLLFLLLSLQEQALYFILPHTTYFRKNSVTGSLSPLCMQCMPQTSGMQPYIVSHLHIMHIINMPSQLYRLLYCYFFLIIKSDIYAYAGQTQIFHLPGYHISVAGFLVSQVYLFFPVLQVNHPLLIQNDTQNEISYSENFFHSG